MKRVFLAGLLLFLLVLAGCGSEKVYMCPDGSVGGGQAVTSSNVIYVCPDGRETTNTAQCRFEVPLTIDVSDAETKAVSFVRGHVQANAWQTTLVNAYREGDNYRAQLIISKYNEDSYETTLEINGVTGVATCVENCEYIS